MESLNDQTSITETTTATTSIPTPNAGEYRRGNTKTIPPSAPSSEGRLFEGREKQYRLSERDEGILLGYRITITGHLGEGFYGHVWQGRYDISGNHV